jgi:hypothetical protein
MVEYLIGAGEQLTSICPPGACTRLSHLDHIVSEVRSVPHRRDRYGVVIGTLGR